MDLGVSGGSAMRTLVAAPTGLTTPPAGIGATADSDCGFDAYGVSGARGCANQSPGATMAGAATAVAIGRSPVNSAGDGGSNGTGCTARLLPTLEPRRSPVSAPAPGARSTRLPDVDDDPDVDDGPWVPRRRRRNASAPNTANTVKHMMMTTAMAQAGKPVFDGASGL